MRLIDTHAHLYAKAFKHDRDAMIERAVVKGIEAFYLPNIDSGSIEEMLALEKAYPDRCFAMMGLHPCSVKENYEEELAIVQSYLEKRSFCAVGEIGIDLYWDKTTLAIQEIAFRRQIGWALQLGIPFVIHARESTEEILAILESMPPQTFQGIFHCFTGDLQQAERAINLGFHLGIGGVLTFKNAGLDKTVAEIDLKHLVLETDAPYLTPVPFRGKRNESSYVFFIAEKLAEIKGIPLAEIAQITSANAEQLFSLRSKPQPLNRQ